MKAGLLAAAAGLVVLCCATVGRAAPPSGNPKGLALLEKIHRAYRHVPGVVLSNKGAHSSTTLVLRAGKTLAQQTVITTPSGQTTTYVGRVGGGAFVRDAGSTCWRKN